LKLKVKLSPRLLAVAELVPSGGVVTDIGTDHAHLPVFLVQERRCPRVIAVEKSRGSLRKAQRNLRFFGLEEMIELREGDGLEPLKGEDAVETVVISGLGGKTINRILAEAEADLFDYKRFVMQPMVDAEELRRWLVSRGFYFPREKLAREGGRFYEVIAAEPGEERIEDPIIFELGPALMRDRDPLLIPWLQAKLKHYERLLQALARSRLGTGDPRWRSSHYRYTRIKEVIRDVRQR